MFFELLSKSILAFPLPVMAAALVPQIDVGEAAGPTVYVLVTLAVVAWMIKEILIPLGRFMKYGASTTKSSNEALWELVSKEAKKNITNIEVARGTVVPWIKRQDIPEDVEDALDNLAHEVVDLRKWLDKMDYLDR